MSGAAARTGDLKIKGKEIIYGKEKHRVIVITQKKTR